MSTQTSHLALLTSAWLAYFLIHSLLAGLAVKTWVARHFPGLMPAYRLLFNLIAILLLAVPLWLTFSNPGPKLVEWSGLFSWLGNGLALLALLFFAWSMRYYDGSEFFGLRQLRDDEHRIEDQEHFQLSPLHRYVRHPWYFLSLLLVWTRDMDINMLVSAAFISLYFVLGSRLEEKKLLLYHGDVYRDYQQRVAGLIPLPWKILSAEQAERLLAAARQKHTQ